ncbi:DUF58 domain-containing protein [Microbacterium sp. RU33B]|uniref:DUF58 domain-containing protein n=1 Tax=Microbacterium sp. RU33B TaxID=1907390 RepID=UPI00095F2581|nr:DUF58 domain-containing protein [Microbacterium sp. RU33B]SIT69451.1 Protein of unknown function DUF58 [Microbacterium sp. RU33B]
MRRIWPLTVRGTGALVLAFACFILAGELGVVELMYIGMLLLAVLASGLVSLYLVRRSDRVSRSLSPDIVSVGRDSVVTARVGVRTALPTPPGIWRDTVPKGLSGKAHGVFPALGSGLRAGERVIELEYEVRGMRRGVHAIGPLTVTSTDPFGLAHRTTVFGERTTVTVAPAVTDLPPLTNFAGEAGGTLHTTTNQLGQGADNLVARPYMPGDSMRRIHWRASAHQGSLMVRQEEQESTPEATVVIDRSVLRWSIEALQAPGTDPGFEAAVATAVSVLTRLTHDGYSVEIIDSDGTELAERIDGGDMTEVEGVVNQFATLTAQRDDHLHRLPRVFSGVMTGPVVLIVGRFDPADAATIAPVAHHSTMPILFAVAPVGDALDRAVDLGWHAAAITPVSDLVAAWSAVGERGVSHALG